MPPAKAGKGKKSQTQLASASRAANETVPLDTLNVRVYSLRLHDDDPRKYHIKVTFFENLILSSVIKPIGPKVKAKDDIIAQSSMVYDPADYEQMCSFADCPLIVTIEPIEPQKYDSKRSIESNASQMSKKNDSIESVSVNMKEISCCNVDILPLFIDTDKLCVKKRMEPMETPSILQCKSWENLPLLRMGVTVDRHPDKAENHSVLRNTTYMKITLIGAYNMPIPFSEDDTWQYAAVTRLPTYNAEHIKLVTYTSGFKPPERFNHLEFFPKWESLRAGKYSFSSGDDKLVCNSVEMHNESNIDLNWHLHKNPDPNKIVWGSFHRSLLLGKGIDKWLYTHISRWQWPLEVHGYNDESQQGVSFMAFVNIFDLLRPGVTRVMAVVPLQWYDSYLMSEQCGCPYLIAPTDRLLLFSYTPTTTKGNKQQPSSPTSAFTDSTDDRESFVLIEVILSRPLVEMHLPPFITREEINEMLTEMEKKQPDNRPCIGRGKLDKQWQSTVQCASQSLRRIPHQGQSEYCQYYRQLCETRTVVEIASSVLMSAAVYVNNNFVIQNYLKSEESYEELLLISHVALMNSVCETLMGIDSWYDVDPSLKSARHARQLQDIPHALELFLKVATENPTDESIWREISHCCKDVDTEWSAVCIDKALSLNMRHPLSLLCKACMIYEDCPDTADPFFTAVLAVYPNWLTGWVVASVYFFEREYFLMADEIMKCVTLSRIENFAQDIAPPRAWEYELGDWWEPTPIMPGMSIYYDAADLLLRIRAMPLAEAALARSLTEHGETAAYYHLLALCCRLRGQIDEALCHIKTGTTKFGEITYLTSLAAECMHKKGDIKTATELFKRIGPSMTMCPYSVMLSLPSWEPPRVRMVLVDLLRRNPSAYAWLALARDWIERYRIGPDQKDLNEEHGIQVCAAACAVQALKWDRRSGRAWALLARLVEPPERKEHYIKMAIDCGYPWSEVDGEEIWNTTNEKCYNLGQLLTKCRCGMCME